jgi:dGTPase
VHADGTPRFVVKFGVYDDDVPVFDWVRDGVDGRRQCVEAQVMDLADDVAYSVHDVEDGIVAGRLDLTRLDRDELWATVRAWYLPESSDAELDEALASMRRQGSWPTSPYTGTRRDLAAIKNLTSDLIGRFCGSVQAATFAAVDGPLVRHSADLVVPDTTRVEIGILKGVAAHYVMQATDRVALMERQRLLLAELFSALWERGPEALDRPFADDWAAAADEAGRRRVVLDQVASLTDASAVARHATLVG